MTATAYGSADKLPLAGGTLTGPLVLTGSPAVTIPSGATSGMSWVTDAFGNGKWDYPGANWLSVKSKAYGATGNGSTLDTTAIQNAINDAATAGGTVVYVPPGTYLVNGLTLPSKVRLVGAGSKTSVLKKNGPGTLLSISGPSSDPTGATHVAYSSVENLGFNGNGNTGLIWQTYYADDLLFRDCRTTNNADVCLDSAEFWDSRFYNCVWETNGSATADALTPNVWLRNSAATSGFGNSTDTTNHIMFHGCRWESFHTGAVRVERGAAGNLGQPTNIFLTDSKMESIVINGGPFLYVDTTCREIDVEHLACYAGGWNTGYSTAVDVISFSPQNGSLRDVKIINASASAIVANGVTLNAPTAGRVVSVENVSGEYTTAPTGAHLHFGGTNTGAFKIGGCWSNNGAQTSGTLPTQYAANPPLTQNSGALTDATFPVTPLDGTLGVDTLNKRLYVRHTSGLWSRIALNTIASSVTSTTTIANTTALSTLQSASVTANEPAAGSVYEIEGYGTYSVTGTPTMTFAVYWGGTGGTQIASIPAITAPSGVTGAPFKCRVKLTFRGATTVTAMVEVDLVTNTSTGAVTRYVGTPSSATTVATSGVSVLAVGFTWGTANASNTISLLGGLSSKVN